MKLLFAIWLSMGFLAAAAPIAGIGNIKMRDAIEDIDETIVYPAVDRDEDVVYAYHAINDK
ncbi:hypothetical protein MMC10_003334 [Thelotrema lepadinum]|nr:hypothetical protein [Thelotrema lepadinum]